jgi:hypothetical protein
MAQQTTTVNEVLGGIDREIAAVEGEYKAALAVAAEQLSGTATSAMRAMNAQSAARSAERGSPSGVLVAEAPAEAPELDGEMAMTLHILETRLDQLKELHAWIKIDPQLAHFVEQLRPNPANAAPAMSARSAFAGASATLHETGSRPATRRGIPVALALVLVVLALVGGWLLSLAVPAATLLH